MNTVRISGLNVVGSGWFLILFSQNLKNAIFEQNTDKSIHGEKFTQKNLFLMIFDVWPCIGNIISNNDKNFALVNWEKMIEWFFVSFSLLLTCNFLWTRAVSSLMNGMWVSLFIVTVGDQLLVDCGGAFLSVLADESFWERAKGFTELSTL